ncbi:MAG: phospholipase [Myxococcaceae bacterium]|nr:phospholipase [Myxococcaceae bacterium]
MKQRALIFSVLSLFLWSSTTHTSAASDDAPLQFVERVVGRTEGGGAPDPQAKLPMLIALHGLGDHPEQFVTLFDAFDLPLRVVAPRAPDPYGAGTSWFEIDNPKRVGSGIVKRAELVSQLASQLQKTRSVRGLPLVTGFSQGGILSFAIAAYHAQQFAAALPVAGRLYDPMPAYRKAPRSFRVQAFHGIDDQRVTYAGAERTVARLKALGTNVTLTGFPGVGHTVTPPMLEQVFAALREQIRRLPP